MALKYLWMPKIVPSPAYICIDQLLIFILVAAIWKIRAAEICLSKEEVSATVIQYRPGPSQSYIRTVRVRTAEECIWNKDRACAEPSFANKMQEPVSLCFLNFINLWISLSKLQSFYSYLGILVSLEHGAQTREPVTAAPPPNVKTECGVWQFDIWHSGREVSLWEVI